MMQCEQCEFFQHDASGGVQFLCNPFTNVREPECLAKWQLIRLDLLTAKVNTMVQAYQATIEFYRRIAPLQEKMFRHLEREIDDADEADQWKRSLDDSDEEDDDPFRER